MADGTCAPAQMLLAGWRRLGNTAPFGAGEGSGVAADRNVARAVLARLDLAGTSTWGIGFNVVGNEPMIPKSANGVAPAGLNATPSKPLLAALTELRSDPLSGAAIVAYLAVLKLLLHFYFNAFPTTATCVTSCTSLTRASTWTGATWILGR